MASLNLSVNGPSIKSSHLAVVNGPLPASASPTYAQWALFFVQAPLVNAFQDSGVKESVLKVQSTGDGELADLIEDLNEGRIQFAFVKVKDPNSGLPKCVLIGWCGGGVPERTKGYYTSHMAAVAKALHGYHVQITARSENDVIPETIIQKVADSSGAKYSAGSSASIPPPAPPPVSSKPVFTPTSVSGAGRANPIIAARSRKDDGVDADGWGADAPPVTRTQLEKVESAYKPTKVNMPELLKQHQPQAVAPPEPAPAPTQSQDVVKGGYQPIGKVDIAAIRAQAQKSGDDRPAPVKGAYEPVGKVDIAAIRAKAQPRPDSTQQSSSVNEKGAAFQSQPQQQERLVSLPKPKVASKFGVSAAFMGTKPPAPASLGFSGPAAPSAAPVGAASRTFADQGGKTPAQLWAEKKAKEAGTPVTPGAAPTPPAASPMTAQKSGGEWKSGYTGKSWAPVQTAQYGRVVPDPADDDASQGHDVETPASPSGGVSALRDRFKGAQPIAAAPPRAVPAPEEPAHAVSSVPTAGYALPGLPTRPVPPEPEETENYERDESPVRIAVPVARTEEPALEPPAERHLPPPMPIEEIAAHIPKETELAPDEEVSQVSRGAASAVAEHIMAPAPAAPPVPPAGAGAGAGAGKQARILFDYERAEDNEVELVAEEIVTDIDMVDEDWWLGTNSKGERGLFPSNYVELIDGEAAPAGPVTRHAEPEPEPEPEPIAQPQPPSSAPAAGPTATALFDYEAAEDNEIGFPDGATVTNLEFPDEDWWYGTYNGKSGLFPANYVQLDS